MRLVLSIIFVLNIFSYAGEEDPIVIKKDSCTIQINNRNNQVINDCPTSKNPDYNNDFWDYDKIVIIVISVITLFGIYLTNRTNRQINEKRSLISINIK